MFRRLPEWIGRQSAGAKLSRAVARCDHGSRRRPMTGREAAILIIDDDSAEAELMARAFRKSGFSNPMHAVTGGDEAKKYLRGEGQYLDRKRFPFPRLVLLDHRMPGTTGWEVLQWLRKDPQFMQLFVVIFSGSHNPEDERRALELGANAF